MDPSSPESEPSVATAKEVILSVSSLSKTYPSVGRGPLPVLEELNLDVVKGEVLAIVGESGSGKSTLLQILGGLDRPDAGKVHMGELDVFDQSDEQLSNFRNRMVGFVFQFHHLLPEFSAVENVMMPALVQGQRPSKASVRATELLGQVGLVDRAEHRPGELSGGEKQRVAIARALMNEPGLVLADEPTGNLDEKTADMLHDEVIRLSRELGQTFVIVTHNMRFAALADRVLVLEHGRLRTQV
ncbi:MAG: ABC transporter ATP-binding protein [Bacteroidetes bacterium]|nr:ABC transporter ATP-binding protein [Bacteroidota bacterium]